MAVFEVFVLPVPLPHALALISAKNRQYEKEVSEIENRYQTIFHEG